MLTLAEKEIKTQKFRENASKQRSKIRTLKDVELQNSQQDNYQPEEPFEQEDAPSKQSYLNAANLEEVASVKSVPKSKAPSKKSKKSAAARPAWAKTEAQTEDAKEADKEMNVPSGSIVTGIGIIAGVPTMIVANDSTVKGGTYHAISEYFAFIYSI